MASHFGTALQQQKEARKLEPDINKSDRGVEVVTRDMTFTARKVVTTVPPQLLAHTVKFSPALPTEVMNVARETHTWMGDSMKGAITYAKPFWKEEGLAGALYSNAGPFVQMYDQTSTDGEHFALVGFMDDSIAHLPEKEGATVEARSCHGGGGGDDRDGQSKVEMGRDG